MAEEEESKNLQVQEGKNEVNRQYSIVLTSEADPEEAKGNADKPIFRKKTTLHKPKEDKINASIDSWKASEHA